MTEYTPGTVLPPLTVTVNRTDLIRYAGASGDLNPIHWSDRVATSVELPGVVAHGMLTMAFGARLVTDWLGDPGAVRSWSVRFTRPVPVPDMVSGVDAESGGAVVELTGTLKSVDEVAGVRTGTVDVKALLDGRAVLGRAVAVVTLPR